MNRFSMNNFNDRIALIVKENQQLKSLRDFLLPMLMNGQVTIKDQQIKEHKKMLYPYAVLANDLTVTYTQVIKDSNNTKILVHFEQPTDYGFKEARYSLPGFVEVYNYNYTQSETERNLEFLKRNAASIIKKAEEKSEDKLK